MKQAVRAVAKRAIAACLAMFAVATVASGQTAGGGETVEALIRAYPEHLDRIEGNDLVWKDGTRMVIDAGRVHPSHDDLLDRPDLKDMFYKPYRVGVLPAPPPLNDEPGRVRHAAFFNKLYGDCRKGEVARQFVDVVWLPKKWGRTLKVTRVNGVAEKLRAVSAELDALPAKFDGFLFPSAGTYNCRVIAGTDRVSAHGHGIAIDLATKQSDYWQWAKGKSGGAIPYKNRFPQEIVDAFERHGFIWGGKWYHYDTMHFEYRPELLPAAR